MNTAAYDSERLALDEQARAAMAATAAAVAAAPAGAPAGAWKWPMRTKIWDFMEAHDIARYPRPVHHRIPNFVDAEKAAARLAALPEFLAARCVKVRCAPRRRRPPASRCARGEK